MNHYTTAASRIDQTIKRCHGIMDVIQKARAVLPLKLLKLSYTALVRPHLEYCSLAFAGASMTNLTKLDTVQKIASRLICHEARDAHAEPLLNRLIRSPNNKKGENQ